MSNMLDIIHNPLFQSTFSLILSKNLTFIGIIIIIIIRLCKHCLGHKFVEAFAVELGFDGGDTLRILSKYKCFRIMLRHFVDIPVLQIIDDPELV